MLTYVLFAVGFVLLVKGADLLVSGATSIARRLRVSDLVIGLTVVAFGTSLPELFVNIISAVRGSPDIAIGNVVGSNIANVLLILGIAALIAPLAVTRGTVWKEIPLCLLACLLLGFLGNDRWIDGAERSVLTRIDGLVFLSFFAIFLYYSWSIAHQAIEGMPDHVPEQQHGLLRSSIMILAGLAGLGLGGKWVVDGAIQAAAALGASESLIGLTIVAIGTSLPELATSAVAAYRGNSEIAVGNVVGSNIFNIFFILGVSSVIAPLPIGPGANADLGVCIAAHVLLFLFMFTGGRQKLDRWEALLFVVGYVGYLAFLVWRG